MELSPSREFTYCAATQELPSTLWTTKVYYHIQKSLLLVPILSQINPVHVTLTYHSKNHINIIHPSTFYLPSRLFPSGFPIDNLFLGSRAWLVLRTLPPSVSRRSTQCGILNISQPYRPPRPVTPLLFFLL
jgi:hypothetical protein